MQIIRPRRLSLNRPLTVTRYWEDMPVRSVAARCHVFNQNGLGAEIAEHLYVGEVVRLEMSPVRGVYATVRNARGNRYGMQFLCLTDNQHRAITGLYEACAIEQANQKQPEPEARPWR